MAQAIDKVVQRAREEEERNVDGPPDMTVPQGTVIQKYSGHRNARLEFEFFL